MVKKTKKLAGKFKNFQFSVHAASNFDIHVAVRRVQTALRMLQAQWILFIDPYEHEQYQSLISQMFWTSYLHNKFGDTQFFFFFFYIFDMCNP